MLRLLSITSAVYAEHRHQHSQFEQDPFENITQDIITYDSGTFTTRLRPIAVKGGGVQEITKRLRKTGEPRDHHRLLQEKQTLGLENSNNLMYTGSVWMGLNRKEIDQIVFDTGSDTFVLETSDCFLCDGAYNLSNNWRTYEEQSDSPKEMTYGDGTNVQGTGATEWVCLSDEIDSCVTNFPFMNV